MDDGEYYVIVQHPMYDDEFGVITNQGDGEEVLVSPEEYPPKPGQNFISGALTKGLEVPMPSMNLSMRSLRLIPTTLMPGAPLK
ncbi:hypothetical protein [Methanolacinia petrolearia]|uniref:hypothetical protein n=1 Tax=Methanolacinia petrolearia TaxID=54120 RepID=UPI003BA89209